MAANETVTNMADITNQLIADAANAEAQRDAVLARIAELEVAPEKTIDRGKLLALELR